MRSLRAAVVASLFSLFGAPALLAMRAEQVLIPMPDGVRLSATLYHPDSAAIGERFPAILEYLPYRKDDGTLPDDLAKYPFVVSRGYVGVRVDIRGTGRSEGRPPDREYSEQEQLDAVEVIAWLARQPWCNGNVGMWGISWGGFNSIQIAARRPPALKAIVPLMATEDLFQDDVHFIDGLFHFDVYELEMEIQPAITRSPDYPLDEASLAERFDNPPWSLLYKKHQRDAPFWRRASLNPSRYDQIAVPTLAIAGWYDGYRDSDPAAAREAAVAGAGDRRTVEPLLAARRDAGPRDRVARGRGAVLRPVPQGQGHGDREGAAPGGLRAALASAGPEPGHGPRRVALRGRLADPAREGDDAALHSGARPRLRPSGGRHALPAQRALGGRRRGLLVGRAPPGPEPGRRLQPRVRLRAAVGGPRDPGVPDRAAEGRGRRAARELVRAALGRGSRRPGDAGDGSRSLRSAAGVRLQAGAPRAGARSTR